MLVERFTEGPELRLWTVAPEQQAHEWYPGQEDKPEQKRRMRGLGKPHGTWVSVPGDRDWRDVAPDMGFFPHGGYVHTFELDTSRVLVIDTLDALDRFHQSHCADPRSMTERARGAGLRSGDDARDDARDPMASFHVRWARVADRCDGVIIAPYQRERRHDYLWYYGWDCACGCIWQPRALTWVRSERLGE